MNQEKKFATLIIFDKASLSALADADVLDLLLEQSTQIVIIESVMNDLISRSLMLESFVERNADRINIVCTSVCLSDREKSKRGEPLGRGRRDLAMADFMMNFIDEVVGYAPAIVICREDRAESMQASCEFPCNVSFVSTMAFLTEMWRNR